MSKLWKYFLSFLLLCTVVIWLAIFNIRSSIFQIIACDVGQGDAILAIYGDLQILTDGGLPNGKVIECLGRHLPFWDRTIEVVVNTHPERDHYGGLIEVFKAYKVENIIVSGLGSSSQEFQVLQNTVQNEGSSVVVVNAGQSIRLGLIQLDIVHPSEEYILNSQVEVGNIGENGVLSKFATKKNKNDFSIVSILSFGEFNALLTGDIEDKVSDLVADRLITFSSNPISYELLKVPHHGSKNGLSQKLLDAVNPKLSAISIAKNNSYGHPHKEVLDILGKTKSVILKTYELGTISFSSDGERITRF